jgi:DNA-binding response OmpR family regulator
MELLKMERRCAKRESEPLPILTCDDIILSPSHRIVFMGDSEISLTKNEFDVLQYLMENSGRFVPHVRLLHKVWGDDYGERDTAVLWQTMNRIRRKLSRLSSKEEYIKVERGIGYMFSLH